MSKRHPQQQKTSQNIQLNQPGTNSALTAEAGYSPGVQAWYNLWVEPDPTSTDPSSKGAQPTKRFRAAGSRFCPTPAIRSRSSDPPTLLA